MNEMHHTTKAVFYVCLTISICMFVGGFLVPPTGVIDGSILNAGGILLGFSALGIFDRILGEGKSAKFERGNTRVIVGEDGDTTINKTTN